MMLDLVSRWWDKRGLTDPQYAFLFDGKPPADEYVSVDCETTGLDCKTAEILSIGAVKIRGNTIVTSESFYVLVKPEGDVQAESIRIHGLRPKDVSDGVPINEALHQLLHFIGNRTLVGYYLDFDVSMINKFLKPMLNIRLPNQQIDVSNVYWQQEAKKLGENHYIDLRLDHISEQLGLPPSPRHNALGDAIHVAQMFLCVRNRK